MVKVGILGAGFMGSMHAQCYKNLDNAQLAGIADVQQEKALEIANKHGGRAYATADELIADREIDIVDVCLPTYMHREYTVKSALAKKHVLCEKPIALTLKDADEMIDVCTKSKVKFMVAQVLRFWPEYVRLKEITDSKALGRLLSMTCRRLGAAPVWSWQSWMTDSKKSGGALVDLHIHDADFLYYLFGRPISIYSMGTDSHIWTSYKFRNNVYGFAEAGWDVSPQFPFTALFTAVFEKGTVDFDCRREKSLVVYTSDKVEYPEMEVMKAENAGGNVSVLGGYFEEIKYFVNCVEKDQNPEVVTARDARNSLEIVLLEKKSAETGRIIKV